MSATVTPPPDDALLGLLGATAAAWALADYRLLCLVRDGFVRQLYARDAAAVLLGEQLRLEALIEEGARSATRSAALGEVDRQWAGALVAAARDLALMRQALEATFDDGSDQAIHRWETARAQAFERVRTLLEG